MAARRVSFDHFWTGFDASETLLPLVAAALDEAPELGPPGDITVTSVFWSRRERLRRRLTGARADGLPGPPAQARYRIWHTPENVRAPASGFDVTWSFDPDESTGTNVYLPLAVLALDWFASRRAAPRPDQVRAGCVVSPEQAAAPRIARAPERDRFACAFVGNPEPRRLRAIEALSRYRPVDVFGALTGRPAPVKAEIARDYRFVICFENDLFPGYVTEKAVEAWGAGSVPLWSGLDPTGLLNPDALVNEADFTQTRDWVNLVADLDRSPEALATMAAQPLMQRVVSLEPVIARLRADLG